jgi:hypothetical protein
LSSTAAALRNCSVGFSIGRLFIGKGASSGVDQGGLTIGGRGQGLGHTPWW